MPDLGLEVLWKGKNYARLLGGLWVALRISLIAALISVAAGILLGVLASRKHSVFSAILQVWLGIIHIMPQMVLLFLMYFGTTRAFGWNLSGETAARNGRPGPRSGQQHSCHPAGKCGSTRSSSGPGLSIRHSPSGRPAPDSLIHQSHHAHDQNHQSDHTHRCRGNSEGCPADH